MVWPRRFWLLLQTLFRRKRTSQQPDNEMQFRLDQQIAENLAAGMNPEAACVDFLDGSGSRFPSSPGWLRSDGQTGTNKNC